jgi:hypothetical protein
VVGGGEADRGGREDHVARAVSWELGGLVNKRQEEKGGDFTRKGSMLVWRGKFNLSRLIAEQI